MSFLVVIIFIIILVSVIHPRGRHYYRHYYNRGRYHGGRYYRRARYGRWD